MAVSGMHTSQRNLGASQLNSAAREVYYIKGSTDVLLPRCKFYYVAEDSTPRSMRSCWTAPALVSFNALTAHVPLPVRVKGTRQNPPAPVQPASTCTRTRGYPYPWSWGWVSAGTGTASPQVTWGLPMVIPSTASQFNSVKQSPKKVNRESRLGAILLRNPQTS